MTKGDIIAFNIRKYYYNRRYDMRYLLLYGKTLKENKLRLIKDNFYPTRRFSWYSAEPTRSAGWGEYWYLIGY